MQNQDAPTPDYLEEAIAVIPEVATLLQEQLDVDDFSTLIKQLARTEAWLGRVAYQYRNAERFLAQAKKTILAFHPKSREYTDLDRNILIEADTRDQQCAVDILHDYAEALAKRLSLGQSFMASQRQEMKSSLR